MTTFEIKDEQLATLKDKVIVVTGCASGIGLATVELLLQVGAKVIAGDVQAPTITHANLTFHRTDVSSWADLTALFELAHSQHGGRIDHVFANAGVRGVETFIDLKTDPATGRLLEPSHRVYDINLRGCLNTSALGFHYMRTQDPPGGSVVLTASASAFQRFGNVDYASGKHGVLGFMRGMVCVLNREGLPIRVNTIGPSWTVTGLLPAGVTEKFGKASQPPEVVARAAAVLMADETRNGQFIYTVAGQQKEIEEAVLLPAAREILGDDLDDNVIFEGILKMGNARAAQAQKA